MGTLKNIVLIALIYVSTIQSAKNLCHKLYTCEHLTASHSWTDSVSYDLQIAFAFGMFSPEVFPYSFLVIMAGEKGGKLYDLQNERPIKDLSDYYFKPTHNLNHRLLWGTRIANETPDTEALLKNYVKREFKEYSKKRLIKIWFWKGQKKAKIETVFL